MALANLIALILVVIGCLNWGLIGIFGWNLVSAIFGEKRNFMNSIIYILVFLASIWLVVSLFLNDGVISFLY